MNRRLLLIDTLTQSWWLETLRVESLDQESREDYLFLSGETLCQYLLRRDAGTLVIARGPMPYLSGNKASVGYVSPLTRVPHYSFVGGRVAAQLLNLGIDGICFKSASHPAGESADRPVAWEEKPYIVIDGRAPGVNVAFRAVSELPSGQRGAYYWLLKRELGSKQHAGSILTVGEGARHGYLSANLAADAIYHAGRGGAGDVFARFASALVLRGEPMEPSEFFGADDSTFALNPNDAISSLLDLHCARLSGKTGGTIAKLFTTGADPQGRSTLPSHNAKRLGYELADVGSPRVLRAARQGQTGCHWCQVDCRHYHWVPADYAPAGRDAFLDDFEPTFATFAMLGLTSDDDTLQARLDLLADVDQRLIMPIEQMGCDIMNIGLGLAALFEGAESGFVPSGDLPDFIADGTGLHGTSRRPGDRLGAAVEAVRVLRSGEAAEYPALRAAGDGPQALAERHPLMKDIVFTGGKGTLGNAGHSNTLWTFLMPFSRFFGHYVGQYYKVEEELPPPGSGEAAHRACFKRVVSRLLKREFFWLLCNALSLCAFTFVIFSQDGEGEELSDDDLLVRLLHNYGLDTSRADLNWFSQAFWSQSIDLKWQFGWRPPSAADYPARVYESLSLALGRSTEDLRELMEMLIDEWKQQAGEVMRRFGYEVRW